LTGIIEALAGIELCAAIGQLDDCRSVQFGSGFHDRVDGAGVDDVNRWESELLFLGQFEDRLQLVAGSNTRFNVFGIHEFLSRFG